VIILTFNEESNLPAALDSVKGWAKQVFVVDSYSTDKTVELALASGEDNVHVVQHPFENYSAQWNWALDHLPLDCAWTLKLDADERVTEAFKIELNNHLGRTDVAGYYSRRRMHFMGEKIVHGGFSSTYVLHLWRTGQGSFENRPVNEHVLLKGATRRLESFIEHHDFKRLSDWIEKHNRYSSMEAVCVIEDNTFGGLQPRFFGSSDERRMWLRRVYHSLPARQVFYFLYRYFWELGCLDGKAGLRYCFLHAVYRYWIDLKVEESCRTGAPPKVSWPRRGAPHPQVVGSKLQQQVDLASSGN